MIFPIYSLYKMQAIEITVCLHYLCPQVMTGSGTFESYVSVGSSTGATPDGRLSGQPIASDCSPQPFPQVKAIYDAL